MLRITINNVAQTPSLVVEGKLVGPWVKELEKLWESMLATEPSWAMVVDLTAMTFVDSDGRELLTRMRRQGAMLVSAGVLMNAIADFAVLVTRLTTEGLAEEQRMALIDQFIRIQGLDSAFQIDLHDLLMILITILIIIFWRAWDRADR